MDAHANNFLDTSNQFVDTNSNFVDAKGSGFMEPSSAAFLETSNKFIDANNNFIDTHSLSSSGNIRAGALPQQQLQQCGNAGDSSPSRRLLGFEPASSNVYMQQQPALVQAGTCSLESHAHLSKQRRVWC